MLMAGIACADYCPSWQWTDVSLAVGVACVLLMVCLRRSGRVLFGLVVYATMFTIGFLLMGQQLKLTHYDVGNGISWFMYASTCFARRCIALRHVLFTGHWVEWHCCW